MSSLDKRTGWGKGGWCSMLGNVSLVCGFREVKAVLEACESLWEERSVGCRAFAT